MTNPKRNQETAKQKHILFTKGGPLRHGAENKMKKANRTNRTGIIFATAMLAAIAAPNAFAATTYTPVAGTSCSFNKYLIMDAGDNVPNVTFSFTAAPGSAISEDTSDNDVMQVLAGIGTPTVSSTTFSPSDTTQTSAGTNIDVARPASERASGLTAATGVELEAGEKYATKTATISFTGITFPEPGIYRYIITETASSDHEQAGIMHDNDVDRVLDVYVTDNESGTLVVSAYVLHTSVSDVTISSTMGSADVAAAGNALEDKTDGFTNEYNTKDIVFKKEVTGNQASRDKYFEFTATMTNIADDDVFTVSIADDNNASTTDGNADATSGTTAATIPANQGKTNPTSVTGAQLKAGQKFYLQHGQSIAIRGLALNAGYTITENEEDYKKTASTVTGFTDATTGTIGTVAGSNKTVKTSFKNERSGIIPTGVTSAARVGIAAAIIGAVGLFALIFKRKKRLP